MEWVDPIIELGLCGSGYIVRVDGERIGNILLYMWQPEGWTRLTELLAVPMAIDKKTLSFNTIGKALDYLLDNEVSNEQS